MGTSCVAYGCTNRVSKKIPGITFHSFPKDDRRETWINAVRRKDWMPSKYSKLCSVHFTEDMIDRTSLSCVRLRETAIPVIFDAFPSYLKPKQKCTKRKPPSTVHFSQVASSAALSVPTSSAALSVPTSSAALSVLTSSAASSITLLQHDNVDVNPSPSKEQLKRKLECMTEVLELKNKKLKMLHQKTRRYKKRITTLNLLLSELKNKNYLNDDAIHVLETVSNVNKEFLTRQLSCVNKQPLLRVYSPELRAFALTLHFYSPRAYEFVRKTFKLALPHQRTLCRWYRRINGEPGFTEECFNAIGLKIKNCSYPLFFSLIVDEMAIRQHVEFDGENFHGYVDFGQNDSDDTLPLAKETFVILLVCINDHWKLPLGYFLTAGINAGQRKTLITNCLILLHKIGVNVVSLTFDGLAANLTMMKSFGCCLESENLITTFPNPANTSSFISVFLDPCHMLKLVRNTFGDKGSLCYENSLIDFSYVKSLHELQDAEGLHLGNKLRAAHVSYTKQKMKVKLASQLFSKSVADAIEYCRIKLKLSQFEGSETTVEFIRIFNDLFDVLNSRSPKRYGFKKAINKTNFEEIKSFLRMADSYISALKVSKNGDKILDSNRKTGFLGFKICIKSLLAVIEHLVLPDNAPLLYFPVYKISQDHLELFFSSVRFHGGNNNNPTARQFRAAYKKLLIHSELKSSFNGNCIPLTEISILNVPNYNTPENVINLTSHSSEDVATEPCQHNFIFQYGSLSECSQDIVHYIAGFVTKKLQSILKCDICINALSKQDLPRKLSLISFKSNGKLIHPSDDLFTICKKCEMIFRKNMKGKNLNLEQCKIEALKSINCTYLFSSLNDHQYDTEPLDNHVVHLVRAIMHQYFNIRMKYHCKNTMNKSLSDRQILTKAILFKGQ